MVTASKLEDLYNELKNAAPDNAVPEIKSRNTTVSLISKPDVLLKRTWQQEDLYVFSCWLPAGRVGVKLNLDLAYLQQRNTQYYLQLVKQHLESPNRDNGLQSVYLAFAALKNLLLLYKLLCDIEKTSEQGDKLSRAQLRILVQIVKDKDKILALSHAANTRLMVWKTGDIANALHKEIVGEFAELERLIEPILKSREDDLAAPVSPAKTPPAPPMLIPSIPIFNLYNDEDDDSENEEVKEDELEEDIGAPSLCVLFSSCLGFLSKQARSSEEDEFEMQEMLTQERANQGYTPLQDNKR